MILAMIEVRSDSENYFLGARETSQGIETGCVDKWVANIPGTE